MGTFTSDDFEKIDNERGKLLGKSEGSDDDDDQNTVDPEPQLTGFEGDEIPEELRGKSPQEIVELYNEVKTTGTRLAGLLRTQLSQPQQHTPPPKEEPPPRITADDVLGDDAAINEKIERLFEHKARPYAAQMTQMAADAQYTRAFQQYPHLQDYREEVNELIRSNNITPQVIAMPVTWEAISNQILRTHFDEIAAKRAKAREAVRPPPPDTAIRGDNKGRLNTGQAGEGKLTKAQIEAAKALGVDPKEAALYASMFNVEE